MKFPYFRPIVDSIEENAPAESSVPRAEADDQTEEKPDRTEQLENSSPLLSQNFSVNIHPSAGVLDTNESTIESGRKADNSCQPGAAERDMRPKLEADEQQNQKSRVEGEYSVQSSQTSKAITWEPDLLASDQNLPAASSVPSNQDQNVDTEATKLFSLTSETNKPVAEEQEASESYLASGLNGNEVVG